MKLPLLKPAPGEPRDRLAFLSLLALVAVVYFPAIGYDFVNWDDPWYVTHNPTVQRWSFENLASIVGQPAVKNYAPVTMFSFLLDYTFWKHNVGGYHFTNIVLHGINSLLVYVLLFRLTGSRRVGWLTAALFAVHPVHLESVAWVSSRKGLLAAAFLLAASIFWMKKEREPRHEGLAIMFLFLALLSKAIAVVVPPIWLLYDIKIRQDSPAQAVAKQVVPVFLCVCLVFVTLSAQSSVYGGIRKHMELGKLHILGIDAIVLWRYVGMLVWPNDLNVLYDPPLTGNAGPIFLAVCVWLLVGGVIWKLRHRLPWIFLSAASFLLFLLPVLNLTPISTLMNDRYLYMPSIPFFAMIVLCWDRSFEFVRGKIVPEADSKPTNEQGWLRSESSTPPVFAVWGLPSVAPSHPESVLKPSPGKKIFSALLLVPILAVVLLATMTRLHLPVWKNSLSLWQHAAKHEPQLAVVQYQLADAFVEAGDRQSAIDVLEWAIRNCDPDRADRKRMLAMRDELLQQLASSE